jgi:hypothetical protein
MAESEPVAELAPQFSSDDATATPWAVARAPGGGGHVLAGDAGRGGQSRGIHGLGRGRPHDRYLRQHHLWRGPRLADENDALGLVPDLTR